VRSGEGFEAAELPWFLTLHWGWLLVAEGAAAMLRQHFNWNRWASVDILLLWSFLQVGWLSRVDQRSNAIYWYVTDLLLGYGATSGVVRERFPTLAIVFSVAAAVITIASLFHFRREMQRYFKDTDDIDLYISPGMTFFFNTLYFQSRFCEVARVRSSDPCKTLRMSEK
jgi:hypothetical protein